MDELKIGIMMTKTISDEDIVSGSLEVLGSCVRCRSENLIAIEVCIADEDFMIAAYGDSQFPSIIFANNNSEKRKFAKLIFNFDKFKVWSADLSGDILRVCLIK